MSKTKNATATSQWNARSLRVKRRTSAGARLTFGLSSRVAIPNKLCAGAPGVVGRADALALLLKAYVRSLSLADDSSALVRSGYDAELAWTWRRSDRSVARDGDHVARQPALTRSALLVHRAA